MSSDMLSHTHGQDSRPSDPGVDEKDDDDDEQPEAKKLKVPSRTSAYEVAKKSIVSKLTHVRTHYLLYAFLLTFMGTLRDLESNRMKSCLTSSLPTPRTSWRSQTSILSLTPNSS